MKAYSNLKEIEKEFNNQNPPLETKPFSCRIGRHKYEFAGSKSFNAFKPDDSFGGEHEVELHVCTNCHRVKLKLSE